MAGTLCPRQQAVGGARLAIVERAVGRGHQRRLDRGRRPVRMRLLEQQGDARDVRAGHRRPLVGRPFRPRHQGARHDGIARRGRRRHGSATLRGHAGDHVNTGRRDVGLEDVAVTLVRTARREAGHQRRRLGADREAADLALAGTASGIGLDRRTVGAGDLHGGHRLGVRVHRLTGGRIHQHHAHATRGGHGGTLVDARVAATRADHDLAGHLGGVEFVRAAEAQLQVGARACHAGLFGQDQVGGRQRRRIQRTTGVRRTIAQLDGAGEGAVMGGCGDGRDPGADVCNLVGRAAVARGGGDEHTGDGGAVEGLLNRVVDRRLRAADRIVDDVDTVLDGRVDGGHRVGGVAAVAAAGAIGRAGVVAGPADLVGGHAGARRHAGGGAQREPVDDGRRAVVARRGRRGVVAVATMAQAAAQGVAR
mmetsp:Transcript_5649/g.21848  ORF Transcript_5649/g.21848 Transcript_5649/m.21848 type:complete len:422 (+) Transcript_5649:1660-2925(+)